MFYTEKMRNNGLYKKLFLSPYFFTIAIRRRKAGNIWEKGEFVPDFVMPSTYSRWAADPVLFDFKGETYLFYEAVEGQHGHLKVCRVNEDSTLSEPLTVLRDSCHYSYPFVFEAYGEIFMIPESSQAREVRLYKADSFPEKWSPVRILLNERAVDTTVFDYHGMLYLMTFMTDEGTEKVTPRIYHMQKKDEGFDLSEMTWKGWDALKVRGAGPVLKDEEKRIRPAQVSLEQRYGDAVAFMEVMVNGDECTEKELGCLKAEHIHYDSIYIDGLHTYSRSKQFEAIDVRCREFELLKIKRLLKKALRNIQKKRG